MKTNRYHIIGACLLNAAASGCGISDLVTKHFAKDRKADAKEHWDSVRGGVKIQLARQQLESGRLEDAEKTLEQTLAIAPKDVQVYLLMTRLRLEQGKLAEARQTIMAAAALPGDDPEVPYLTGVVAQRYGNSEQALQSYAAAAAKAPHVPEYQLARIESLVALDRLPEAYEIAIAVLPDFDTHVPLRMLVARLSMMLGLRGPAVEQCRQALRLETQDPTVGVEAGLILVWADRFEEAVRILGPLAAAVDLPSKDALEKTRLEALITPSVRHALASANLALHRYTEAMLALKPLMNAQKADSAACIAYARAAIGAGDPFAAAQAIALAHDKAPPNAETLLISAYLAFSRGEYRESLELANRAAGLDDGFAEAYCLMGQSAQAVGQTEDARRWYMQSLVLDPGATQTASLLEALGPEEGLPSIPFPENDTVRDYSPQLKGLPAR